MVELVPGVHPFEELEDAILRIAARPIASLRDRLESGSRGLLEVADDALSEGMRAVVIVD